jgi:hypothetical protein
MLQTLTITRRYRFTKVFVEADSLASTVLLSGTTIHGTIPISFFILFVANAANHRQIGAMRGLWHSPQTNVAEICPSEFDLLD